MRTVRATGIKPIGWTDDNQFVALSFKASDGNDVTIEFPVARLEELGLISAQLATATAKMLETKHEPKALPIAGWSVGMAQSGDVVLKMEYPKEGALSFAMTRTAAGELRDAIGTTLSQPKVAN